MTSQRSKAMLLAQSESFERNKFSNGESWDVCGFKMFEEGFQAAQADQAERVKELELQNTLYADDELVMLADRDILNQAIAQLQLDNQKMRSALESIKRYGSEFDSRNIRATEALATKPTEYNPLNEGK